MNGEMANSQTPTTVGSNINQTPASLRKLRGLRTLEHDIAELKGKSSPINNNGNPQTKAGLQSRTGTKQHAVEPARRVPPALVKPVAQKPPRPAQGATATNQKTSPNTNLRKTNFKKEFDKLADMYIPAKEKTPPSSAPVAQVTAKADQPIVDEVAESALQSFESNRAFNEEIHKEKLQKEQAQNLAKITPAQPPKATETKTIESGIEIIEPKEEKIPTEADLDLIEVVKLPENKDLEEKAAKAKAEAEEKEKQEAEERERAKKKAEEKAREEARAEIERIAKEQEEKEKKAKTLDALTAADIERELSAVLNKDEKPVIQELEKVEKPKKPLPTLKELDIALDSLTLKIASSASRIDSYLEEFNEATKTLENLNERRSVIDKNLNPIKTQEREILNAIKKHEEEESKAVDKVEKRAIERNRWKKEIERRNLEDDRWRLEEIFEKLKHIIERTERELDSAKEKLESEQRNKRSLEKEKRTTSTQRDLVMKKEERWVIKGEIEKIQGQVAALRNELTDIQTREHNLENEKRQLDAKIANAKNTTDRRELEEKRRDLEDRRRKTEEERWEKEDALKAAHNSRKERSRVLAVLNTETDALQKKFNEEQVEKMDEDLKLGKATS